MTPLALELPEPAVATASSALPVEDDAGASATRSSSASATVVTSAGPGEVVDVGEPDFPDGIDYDRWAGRLTRAPRSAFVDSLDDLDLVD